MVWNTYQYKKWFDMMFKFTLKLVVCIWIRKLYESWIFFLSYLIYNRFLFKRINKINK